MWPTNPKGGAEPATPTSDKSIWPKNPKGGAEPVTLKSRAMHLRTRDESIWPTNLKGCAEPATLKSDKSMGPMNPKWGTAPATLKSRVVHHKTRDESMGPTNPKGGAELVTLEPNMATHHRTQDEGAHASKSIATTRPQNDTTAAKSHMAKHRRRVAPEHNNLQEVATARLRLLEEIMGNKTAEKLDVRGLIFL